MIPTGAESEARVSQDVTGHEDASCHDKRYSDITCPVHCVALVDEASSERESVRDVVF